MRRNKSYSFDARDSSRREEFRAFLPNETARDLAQPEADGKAPESSRNAFCLQKSLNKRLLVEVMDKLVTQLIHLLIGGPLLQDQPRCIPRAMRAEHLQWLEPTALLPQLTSAARFAPICHP